jgi:hypothetical protein
MQKERGISCFAPRTLATSTMQNILPPTADGNRGGKKNARRSSLSSPRRLCLPLAPSLPSASGRIRVLPYVPDRIRALTISRSQHLLQSRRACPWRTQHRWAHPQPSPPLVGHDKQRTDSTPPPSRTSSTSFFARVGPGHHRRRRTSDLLPAGATASSSDGPSLTRGQMPSRRDEMQFCIPSLLYRQTSPDACWRALWAGT